MPTSSDQDLLIKNAAVVSVDSSIGNLHNSDIHVRNGAIAAIGADLEVPGANVIDATSMIAAPGFVDAHRHLWEGLLRGALPDADLTEYFRTVNGAFAPAHGPEDVHLGELVSALAALDAGVTTVLDWSHVQTTPDHTRAALDALRVSGVRAVFAFGPPGARDRGHRWPHDLARLRNEELDGANSLVTLGLATMSPEHQPYETVVEHLGIGRDAGALVTMHAGLNGMSQPHQVTRMGRDGLLGPDVNLVHCNTFEQSDWQVIADTGTSVSITPSIELQMGHGVPPMEQALRAGVTPALGVDVETSTSTDMWTQMKFAFGLQRSRASEARLSGRDDSPVPTTAQALEWATLGGAVACQLGSVIGSLTVGKRADIVLLRTDMVHIRPINDLTSALVHSMDVRNVDTVIVDGRIVKRHGALVGVDVAALWGRVYEARDRVFAKAGQSPASSTHR